MEQLAAYPQSQLPSYLFRVYSERSMGINTPEKIRCQYYRLLPDERLSFEETDSETFKFYLQAHIQNKKIWDSLFISFSASLLTTLQRAEWLKQRGDTDIRIAVFRPRGNNQDHLVIPLTVLQKAFDITEDWRYIQADCSTEFLAWGEIGIPTHHVSHSTLIRNGLYRLLPELEERFGNRQLGAQLAHLRQCLFKGPLPGCIYLSGPDLIVNCAMDIAEGLTTGTNGFNVWMLCCVLGLRNYRYRNEHVNDCVKIGLRVGIHNIFFGEDHVVKLDTACWCSFDWKSLESDKPEIVRHHQLGRQIRTYLQTEQRRFADQARLSVLDLYGKAIMQLEAAYFMRKDQVERQSLMKHVYPSIPLVLDGLLQRWTFCFKHTAEILFRKSFVKVIQDDLKTARNLTTLFQESGAQKSSSDLD